MSVHVPSLHVPSVRMPSIDAPVAASRDLIDTFAKAADSLGEHVIEPVIDAVTDGVGTIADSVTALLPNRDHRRRRRIVAVGLAAATAIVVVAAARRRSEQRARRTQDALAVDLADRSDQRNASSGDGASLADDRVPDAPPRDTVHAAD